MTERTSRSKLSESKLLAALAGDSILAEKGHGQVSAMTQHISAGLAREELSVDDLEETVRHLRDAALHQRAAHLRYYVGLDAEAPLNIRMIAAARQLVAQCARIEELHDRLARPAFSAVFTAHPTFALSDAVYEQLAHLATDPILEVPKLASHRRLEAPTLWHEQDLALAAILRGRDAIDALNRALLEACREKWPDATVLPSPVVLASWVGFDTDGRSDIHWWDTIAIRLALKETQLRRLTAQLSEYLPSDSPLLARLRVAIDAVFAQRSASPQLGRNAAKDVAAFAAVLVGRREEALVDAHALTDLYQAARETCDAAARHEIDIAWSGFTAHGLSAAHIHTRLNATQIYNVVRHRLSIEDDPAIPSRRRKVIGQINEALNEKAPPVPVDFGSLLMEQISAARLMMTMAQILKHIDQTTPIRFLIAETESGFTLLATLWLSRHFGIRDDQIQISPLFETQSALEHGDTILEECFRSPHWRDYLRNNGRLCLQFGYSDSGRYIGQLAATNLVERLRLKTLELMRRHELTNIELVLFDTHGESIGRGSHPFSLQQRLEYFSPAYTAHLFKEANIRVREEAAFQGADGYTLFGTPELATSTVVTIAEHLSRETQTASSDPIYANPEFSFDFFSTIALDMATLVEDPGYAGMLGAFGPALIDKSGSRPSARQADGANVTRITHVNQLRAIPNNAILEQLGWWANVLQGLGSAAARHADSFERLSRTSRRFDLALDFARQALSHSDIGALRAVVDLLDPGTWLDRAANSDNESRRSQYMRLAKGLEELGFWRHLPPMYRHVQADHISLNSVWSHGLYMARDERILHAIRHAVIEEIWLLATRIPYFSPRNNISRERLLQLILQLEIPLALKKLGEIFPQYLGAPSDLSFHEPQGARDDQGFMKEHETIFRPMARLFDLLREISTAVMHANGAFG
ncbi:phosphoenolpyruvate carboxylase [Candidatus Kirkpatrickella diaphorinae]|uniref:Phosphoenolpyruvate carboxylase n=1 Tax=Candidatus Kirkpatrickella diaphorinae TaxID=2984322 RepID=A0ABY6GLX3_9PROT|nr:phosphoenolpyruvate carboxylase [Candidatus Kirkpatrickella diaphorinae]UYH51721.1 phosphoenolpyruvate carboxylase [Candidatus Kirkpatrickella diaphorinae]